MAKIPTLSFLLSKPIREFANSIYSRVQTNLFIAWAAWVPKSSEEQVNSNSARDVESYKKGSLLSPKTRNLLLHLKRFIFIAGRTCRQSGLTEGHHIRSVLHILHGTWSFTKEIVCCFCCAHNQFSSKSIHPVSISIFPEEARCFSPHFPPPAFCREGW